MRVLYLTSSDPDYLSDDLLYGLRAVLGPDVVDCPRKDVLYKDSSLREHAGKLYGRGFHLFGLEDIEVDREDIARKVCGGYFDAIINSSCWRIESPLHPRLVVFDGEDHDRLQPKYLGNTSVYFKREASPGTKGIEPISFALPDFLFDETPLPKGKKYHASFMVNSPVRRELEARFQPFYQFSTWKEYLQDIKESWFGISPKGAGYDCQRHYEIFGQAVLCIYLDKSAPRFLQEAFIDGVNCLTFQTVHELVEKMEGCSDPRRLIAAARADLKRRHLASKRAESVLEAMHESGIKCQGASRQKLGWVGRLEWSYWLARQLPKLAKKVELKPGGVGILGVPS